MPAPYTIGDAHWDKLLQALNFIRDADTKLGLHHELDYYLKEYGSLVAETPANDAILDGFIALSRYNQLDAIRSANEDTLKPSLEAEYQALKTALGL